jgi:hypothetical protein
MVGGADLAALRDLLDVVQSWLIDECPPEAREEYRAQLATPVRPEDKAAERRRQVMAAAMASDGEIV